MPILKQLVSGSSQTKRRSRMDLTREMISAPLGDFRHTMHVGRSGDAFGDTSFLSTRSGEPPSETTSFPRSPRPGLLSRTFRSSKRSQSVTRVDQQKDDSLVVAGGSPTYVKNAMSLPFLNDEDRGDDIVSKSMSSSPLNHHHRVEVDGKGAAAASYLMELDERNFGELTELPESSHHFGGGMKHAESVMSFHVDLGPSMLGDILGVMEKEEDDLGYEEGKSSEDRDSPPLSTHGEEEDGGDKEDRTRQEEEDEEDDDDDDEEAAELQPPSTHPPSSFDLGPENGGPYTPEYTPETRPKHLQHLEDSCSMSSSGSAAFDEKPNSQTYAGDTDSATFSAPPEEESNFSSFLEDEDDEIRV
ncbi:cdc42 effector protein 4a [Sphaeramia orbicularis]|uniref:Cdc42 effector protein 4-like n=1 Tax=Sphaeramia orbicularis TaxID=375764 RepID=A0A672YF78_9TELE|nr:cdc42 effector protein 4-like [Sphaeramia orbicularis]XP_029997844.1 cdc42 effector protein 4-like [Sphaeramia orbicularis]XP_029997845.1 cdc42 effector protein 4-like [Sphaeramia orbicularis]